MAVFGGLSWVIKTMHCTVGPLVCVLFRAIDERASNQYLTLLIMSCAMDTFVETWMHGAMGTLIYDGFRKVCHNLEFLFFAIDM